MLVYVEKIKAADIQCTIAGDINSTQCRNFTVWQLSETVAPNITAVASDSYNKCIVNRHYKATEVVLHN